MNQDITKRLTKLNTLLETAVNPKILLEEMQILSDKAFTLQDELNALLDEAEQKETDIAELQNIFSTREVVWDAITSIAKREMQVKEKSFKTTKTSPQPDRVKTTHSKGCANNTNEECCCHHHKENDACCCHHHESEAHHCCCHDQTPDSAPKKTTKRGCQCKKN